MFLQFIKKISVYFIDKFLTEYPLKKSPFFDKVFCWEFFKTRAASLVRLIVSLVFSLASLRSKSLDSEAICWGRFDFLLTELFGFLLMPVMTILVCEPISVSLPVSASNTGLSWQNSVRSTCGLMFYLKKLKIFWMSCKWKFSS